jgi:hypothetical protein
VITILVIAAWIHTGNAPAWYWLALAILMDVAVTRRQGRRKGPAGDRPDDDPSDWRRFSAIWDEDGDGLPD